MKPMQHGSDLCHCRLLEKNKKMDKRLRKIARYCKILQDIARYCKILQDIARYCKILQDIARYCKVRVAVVETDPERCCEGLGRDGGWT